MDRNAITADMLLGVALQADDLFVPAATAGARHVTRLAVEGRLDAESLALARQMVEMGRGSIGSEARLTPDLVGWGVALDQLEAALVERALGGTA